MTKRLHAEPKAAQTSGNSALYPLYLVTLMDSLSFSLIMPFIPFMLIRYGGDARVAGFVFTIHALMSILSAPVFGILSDKIGRKPVLSMALGGTAASYVLFALADSLWLLVASRAIAGLMAGNYGVVQAALADATNEQERGKAISFATGASAIGFVAGPIIGISVTMFSPEMAGRTSSLFGALVLTLSIVVVWCGLAPANRTAKPGGPLHSAALVYANNGVNRPLRTQILTVLGAVALVQSGLIAITGYWANAEFGWTERGVSLLMLWIAICIILLQILVMPRLFQSIHLSHLLAGSLMACSIGAALMWASGTQVWITALGAAALFCGITASQAVMITVLSKLATEAERGFAMGSAVSAGSIGRVIGPTLFGFILVSAGALAPYLAVVAISLACAVWTLFTAGGVSAARQG